MAHDTEPSTQDRILEAALEEFAAKGISGARVDQIAKRAGVNVRMLYHYFESKRNLFREVNAYALRENEALYGSESPASIGDDPFRWVFGKGRPNPKWVRVLGWEELESLTGGEEVVNHEARHALVQERIEQIRVAQTEGRLPADLDAGMLYLALHALTRVPYVFPTLTRSATGLDPASPEFAERYDAFLARLGKALVAGGPSADS